jgi:hypothetical protein
MTTRTQNENVMDFVIIFLVNTLLLAGLMCFLADPIGLAFSATIGHGCTLTIAKEQPTGAQSGAQTNWRCIMKSLTINTLLVAVALAVSVTPSLAMDVSSMPVSLVDKEMQNARATTSVAPLHALSRLDGESLAGQEMTDQELKAIEGGTWTRYTFGIALGPLLYTTNVLVDTPFALAPAGQMSVDGGIYIVGY